MHTVALQFSQTVLHFFGLFIKVLLLVDPLCWLYLLCEPEYAMQSFVAVFSDCITLFWFVYESIVAS